MKHLLSCLLLASTATMAQPARPMEFEATPGCMWSKSAARCIVSNRLNVPVACKVTVTGQTSKGMTIGNTRRVVIQPQRFDDTFRIFAADDEDGFSSVTASADCVVE